MNQPLKMDKIKTRITEFDKSQASIKSVLRPCAHSYEEFQPDKQTLLSNLSRVYGTPLSSDLSLVELCVIDLLMFSGIRISELLRIDPWSILKSGHINVKGLKGSNDRIIIPVFSLFFWQGFMVQFLPLVDLYSRFYFYRRFKKLGIYTHYDSRKHQSITHFFRHRVINQLNDSGVPQKDISTFIGHKNKKTLKYYLKDEYKE